ncbi:MAG: penicillin-binding protein 2 [Euzebya sp.]
MQPSNAKPPISRESTALRLTFLGALVVSLFVLLVGRLWFLQVMTGSRFVARAEDQSVRTIEIEAPRGDILDRNGVAIVDNRFAQVVSVRPDQMGDEETRANTISELAYILRMSQEQIEERINDQRAGPFANRPIAIDVPDDVVFYIHQNRATRFPGVIAERIPLREYPHGDVAAHVVGYTGQISPEELADPQYDDYGPGDIIGWAGVERSYEQYLQGTAGERRVRVSSRGEILEDLTDDSAPQAIPGDKVQLTLDLGIQQQVEEALVAGINLARETPDSEGGPGRGGNYQAPAGAAVVLDADTGEIVAMASYPTYDPEQFVGGVSQTYWDVLQDQENHFPLINRAIGATYPPGSVFKIVSAAAAMTYGFAAQDSYIPCPGEYEYGGNTYRNWFNADQGSFNIAESLMRSCDTVYYYLARQMFNSEVNTEEGQGYNERVVEAIDSEEAPLFPFEYLSEMSRQFGLDQITDIDLPGERDGVVPGREWRFNYWLNARGTYCAQAQSATPGTYAAELFNELCSRQGAIWRGGDLVNMSIGQGDVQMSPLQVANMFAAVANRGVIMQPHVVRAIFDNADQPVLVNEPQQLHTVPVSADDLAFIEQGLAMVTSDERGTAYRVFEDFNVPIAGKTGTAENKPRQPFAWFGGYNLEPINSETYVVVAFVEEGGGGSAIAAPIVEQIFGALSDQQVELEAGEITE